MHILLRNTHMTCGDTWMTHGHGWTCGHDIIMNHGRRAPRPRWTMRKRTDTLTKRHVHADPGMQPASSGGCDRSRGAASGCTGAAAAGIWRLLLLYLQLLKAPRASEHARRHKSIRCAYHARFRREAQRRQCERRRTEQARLRCSRRAQERSATPGLWDCLWRGHRSRSCPPCRLIRQTWRAQRIVFAERGSLRCTAVPYHLLRR